MAYVLRPARRYGRAIRSSPQRRAAPPAATTSQRGRARPTIPAAVIALQRAAGNRATRTFVRLARAPQSLKERVAEARRTNPKEYVLKAVQGMAAAGTWTFEEQAAEIVWRMIWMFAPERTERTLVRADPNARGLELGQAAPRGFVELVVGPDFIAGVTLANLDLRVGMLRLVPLGRDGVITRLKADFGFAEVENGSATWTVGELAETHAGLSRMPPAERAALAGVTLRRERSVIEHGQQTQGEFRWGVSSVDAGSGSKPELTQVLKMADGAFVDPDRAAEVALHEAGHAIDSDKRRRASHAAAIATADANKAIDDFNNAADAAGHAVNAAIRRSNTYRRPDFTAASGFIAAVRAAHAAIDAFATGAGTAGQEKAADAAVKARDTARARLPATNPADGDFATACDLQNDWLAAARVTVAARATSARAGSAETAATGRTTPGISLRLERFKDLVVRHGIAPITPYARRNWPGHPEEFFAEAYAMWRTDPATLERLARPLKEFFDAGKHLE
jgi:hypothetical protein